MGREEKKRFIDLDNLICVILLGWSNLVVVVVMVEGKR
jgi:hypothetical protein